MAASGISATTSTETKYPTIINGYLCYSAAEVRAARQMINPRSVDKTTGLPTRNDAATTAASASAANSASASRAAIAERASPYADALNTYTAQGATSRDDQTARRGSLLDILA